MLCQVEAARIGSPLDARLEVLDAKGRTIAENDDYLGPDPRVRFVPPANGKYQVRIRDTRNQGGPAYVYRLTLTADPRIDYFYPLGGKRGNVINVEVAGQSLPRARAEIALPNNPSDLYPHCLTVNGRQTNELLLDLDDLPEYLEGTPEAKGPIGVPAVFNGRISKPGEVDSWSWMGQKGETYEFNLRAARLGSKLDGTLAILDAAGRELAHAEVSDPGQLDPNLQFTAPSAGVYCVQVRDRFRSRGGPDFAYRLRVAQQKEPEFRLWISTDSLTVPRKGSDKVRISVDRQKGFKESIQLRVEGLPPGVSVTGTTIPPDKNAVELQFKATEQAKIEPSHLIIIGSAKGTSQDLAHRAMLRVPRGQPLLDDVLLMVALPTPFEIKGDYEMGFVARGSVLKHKYRIVRRDYDGPIEISLADRQTRHLQGMVGPTILVPAGANEVTYKALLPPWMETGRTCRVCVMGTAELKEADGSLHRVSFSSMDQNEQLVAVVGPGNLSVETSVSYMIASPGRTSVVSVHIKRSLDVRGPVCLELVVPSHIKGLTAEPQTIAADKEQGELRIRCSDKVQGPFNMPVTVRATLVHRGEPHVGEAKVEVLSE